MTSILSKDHAFPNGKLKLDEGSAAAADPSKMSDTDKQAISGVIANDEAKGAAVHVSPVLSVLPSCFRLESILPSFSSSPYPNYVRCPFITCMLNAELIIGYRRLTLMLVPWIKQP